MSDDKQALTGKLEVSARGDLEIVGVRVFDAPRELVYSGIHRRGAAGPLVGLAGVHDDRGQAGAKARRRVADHHPRQGRQRNTRSGARFAS